MHKVKAFKSKNGLANIFPLSVKREWMDNTWQAHAYKCFPVSLTNQLGWGLSFPEDISFIWDGVSDTSSEHVKILKGQKYVHPYRANATISFNTGISFETETNTSLLQIPVPNQPIDGITPFSTIISSSFFGGEFPCAWMITRPNVEITIKANTPIIAILPIDLSLIQNSDIKMLPMSEKKKTSINMEDYEKAIYEINYSGKWSNFYRDAVDDKGNKIGEHQVKAIRLSVTE
jgi:hypothetical protein